MVAIGRFQTTLGPTVVAVDDGQQFALPGCKDPLDLLRAAAASPGGFREQLDKTWPLWRGQPAESGSLILPLEVREVWAAGVTYERSQAARMGESGTPDVYERVFTADRPEIFLKDNGRRTVGPEEAIGVRGDSTWSVPEPELALVLDEDGSILGYTIGNDVTARDIEAANPLYLPQAKLFAAACSLGPVIVPAAALDPYNLEINCRIIGANGEVRWENSTSTRRLARRLDQLVGYLRRYNVIPAGTVLLTGTGLVPPDDVSLGDGDLVEIEVTGIGLLRNSVKGLAQ